MPEPIFELRPPLSARAAIAEASRCVYCHDAPCARACPCQVEVAEFIRKIATGNLRGSARLLLAANPLAASCARVCPVEELCEGACVLPRMGAAPIAIGRLQRHVMDWAMERGGAEVQGTPSGGSVGVVGAGPAGIAAAVELCRLGHQVTVYEARARAGGLGLHAIAGHKLTPELAEREVEWLQQAAGFQLRLGARVGRELSLEALEREHALILLGVGLQEPMRLQIPGEDLPGVVDALELIAAHRLGAPLPVALEGKEVLVIGGGNTATDVAILALQRGAARTRIVYRRSEREMPAYPRERELARQQGVELLLLHAPLAVLGVDRVKGLRCQPMRLGEPDASGRRRPVPAEAAALELGGEVVIRALGQRAGGLLGRIPGLRLEGGRLQVDEQTGQTDNPRYYAAGDCVNGGREVVHAVSQGLRAARAIHRQLCLAPAETPAASTPVARV